MSNKNTGGYIFPSKVSEAAKKQAASVGIGLNDNLGMTLRDYFAAKAMQTILGMRIEEINELYPEAEGSVSIAAYSQADAMLKARES